MCSFNRNSEDRGLRPAGGANHPDSDLAEVGKLSAKKALGQIESSLLSYCKIFKVVQGGSPTLDEQYEWKARIFP